ncbi:hypothetical protein [Streptomyces goshikiensis]|uniref:hypothetical protein n=1 Tax=Streptomyces goshikiensis TaxID=1942 RepID=UPI003653A9EB
MGASPPAPANSSTAAPPIEAACHIVILEDQLEEAQRINAEHRRQAETSTGPTTV